MTTLVSYCENHPFAISLSPTSPTMELRGQRFSVDFSDDEDESGVASRIPQNAIPSLSSAFIGDIKERSTAPPSAPKLKSTPTGFPEHRKRTRISAFKQQRGASTKSAGGDTDNAFGLPTPQPPQAAAGGVSQGPSADETERRRIDEENKKRLEMMSSEEIDEERQELLAGLNPSLIQRLLKRANLDEGRGDTGIEAPSSSTENEKPIVPTDDKDAVPAPTTTGKPVIAPKSVRFEEEEPTQPIALQPASNPPTEPIQNMEPAVHFPNAPSAPDLDPSDPSFLENLHSKYFPTLPADPSKLAWMAPIPTHGSVADQESPYYPAHEALPASALRFDFRGGLLPPRISRAMPSTKGLHHHGEAPEAAGYTVPELARLARSAYPAQRCIAFQTLGRLLYRLGRGELGYEDSEIAMGLWRCVEEGKIVETLEEASNAEGGHQGSKVYAVEATWLWQKGGGKRWKAT
ncbi:RNA polymerase II-associated protein [Lachnellula occidentalis]|uniref:RNA polymerase II-associated protein n=1 Tax=Lachnellula occidentalis TaxID=215460 RepID=A0A8H8UKI3_9HELO|nr:RNA polymerase II-associated protein [Lachnellula occidentalis]